MTITIRLKNSKILNKKTLERRSAYLIRKNADKLMKRLKRQYGKFEYVRVLEQHKSGQLHIHIMASFHFSDLYFEKRGGDKKISVSKSLKNHALACGFGYITHAENLVDADGQAWVAKRAVSYITKYITKDTKSFDALRKGLGVRKIQTSRGILSPFNAKNKNEDDETVWFMSQTVHISEAKNIGFSKVFDVNRKKTLEKSDFNNDDLRYPSDEM